MSCDQTIPEILFSFFNFLSHFRVWMGMENLSEKKRSTPPKLGMTLFTSKVPSPE